MSPDAKYLITVGNEPKPIIKLWIWSLGKDEPDGNHPVQDASVESRQNFRYHLF